MKRHVLGMLSTFLLIHSVSSAADIHVYPSATIQTAVNGAASGDRILLHTGTYSQVISVSGKNGLTITAAGDGVVTLQGNGTTDIVVYIANSSNITLSNLLIKNTFKNNFAKGIYVDGSGSNITISGNEITDISYRTGTWSSTDNPSSSSSNSNPLLISGSNTSSALTGITVTGNTIHHCMTGWSEGIAIKGNVDGFNVANNVVHHMTNIAMDAYGLGSWPNASQARNGQFTGNTVYEAVCNYTDNGGIYVDGGKDIIIANNKVYNSVYGITIGCENQGQVANGTTSGVKVVNNLIYNNRKSAIMIGTSGDDDGVQGNVVNTLVTGNTFLKNATADQWASEMVLQNCSGVQAFNNIFFGSYQVMITQAAGVSGNTFGYNIFYNTPNVAPLISKLTGTTWGTVTLAQFKTDNGDATSTNANPLLVNASATTPDAHLQTTSPCINTGKPGFVPLSGEKDLDGGARINGAAVDKGVDESGASGSVAVTGVTVSPATASIAIGGTQQLTATINPSSATNQTRTWTTSNGSIATVNSSGLVTGVAAGNATVTVTTQDGSFTATSVITVNAAGGALPSPWTTSNIGAVAATGSATHSSGTFTIAGSGADIYGNTDEFRYVYQSLNGNGEIKARIVSQGNTDAWAKAGVMMRETLTTGSNHVLCAITPSNGLIYQRHVSSGDLTTQTQVTGITTPTWVRIVRSGNNFTSYYSSNGTSWTQVASQTIAMGSAVYVGLAVTSHNDGVLSTAVFDNVSVVTSGGSTNITVDGSLSDWSSVSAIASASGQTAASLKVYSTSGTLYFAVSGSGMNSTNYQFFINADNNSTTGYQDGAYTTSGADYMIENGALFQSTGSAWGWVPVTATIQSSKSATVTELGINRSAFASLASAITVGYKDIANWATVSKLPSTGGFAAYSLASARSLIAAGQMEEVQLLSAVSASPNPTKGRPLQVRMSVPLQNNVYAELTDMQGKQVYVKNFGVLRAGQFTHEIPTSSLVKGLYVLRVMMGVQVTSFKIIVD